MRAAKRMFFVGMLVIASSGSATAQNIGEFFDGIGPLGQSRRSVTEEWEKITSGEILCVDTRLRRARRSVNTLINRGIGPSDIRVASIVSGCRADAPLPNTAKPSFNCNAATQPDEIAICSNPELAQLDRAVVENYEEVIVSDGANLAKSIADPLLRRRHACGPDVDCIKRVQLTAISAFQARGSPMQVPTAAQVARGDNTAYVVNGMQLGNSVDVNSPDYRDYACAPIKQYAGFTGCQRKSAERLRRRRVTELAAFLHAADGSTAYINQTLDPVAMDDNDANDEVSRLSQTFGKATLMPMTDVHGVTSGLIASWGAVSLLPLAPDQRQALADGADPKPGILIDTISNLQQSAQLGLPIYRLGGGAGYVWSASWNKRGRGTLRVVAIDASRLPDAGSEAAKPTAERAAVVAAPEAPIPIDATPPLTNATTLPPMQPAVAQASPEPTAPAPVAAPQSRTPAAAAPAPANVRVVGPSIELRATAAAPTPSAFNSSGGNSLVNFLTVLVFVLLGTVAYLLRKSRGAATSASVVAPAPPVPVPAREPDAPVVPEAEKMDLSALVPAESPANIVASETDIDA